MNIRQYYENIYKISLKPKEVIHHIDLNRKNNNPNNLIKLDNQKEHRQLHAQLSFLTKQMINTSIGLGYSKESNFLITHNFIKFDRKTRFYYSTGAFWHKKPTKSRIMYKKIR